MSHPESSPTNSTTFIEALRVLFFLFLGLGIVLYTERIDVYAGPGLFERPWLISICLAGILSLYLFPIGWRRSLRDPIIVSWLMFLGWIITSSFIRRGSKYLHDFSVIVPEGLLPVYTRWLFQLWYFPQTILFVLFALSWYQFSKKFRWYTASLVLLGALTILLKGYCAYFLYPDLTDGHFEILKFNYTTTGRYLLFYSPFLLGLSLTVKQWKYKIPLFTVFFLSVRAIYLTNSRGNLFGIFVTMIAFTVLYLIYHFDRRTLCLSIVLWTVGILSIGSIPQSSQKKMTRRIEQTDVKNLSGRMTHIWPAAVEKISKRPVIGYGLGLWKENREVEYRNTSNTPHNQIFYVLIDGGVIGLILFLFFVFNILNQSLQPFFTTSPPSVFVLAFLCSLLSAIPISMVSTYYYGHLLQFIGWYFVHRDLDR